jgi:NAD(P)-dependent dehydrogenase (short-subunit alcohol dehydrogenase family)
MGSLAYATDKSLPWYGIDYKVYDASKAAVNMLMLNFARVLEEDNGKGRVNAVCPGYVNSNLTRFDARGTSVEMGAQKVVEVAVDDREDGPSRTFSNLSGELPW